MWDSICILLYEKKINKKKIIFYFGYFDLILESC